MVTGGAGFIGPTSARRWRHAVTTFLSRTTSTASTCGPSRSRTSPGRRARASVPQRISRLARLTTPLSWERSVMVCSCCLWVCFRWQCPSWHLRIRRARAQRLSLSLGGRLAYGPWVRIRSRVSVRQTVQPLGELLDLRSQGDAPAPVGGLSLPPRSRRPRADRRWRRWCRRPRPG